MCRGVSPVAARALWIRAGRDGRAGRAPASRCRGRRAGIRGAVTHLRVKDHEIAPPLVLALLAAAALVLRVLSA